jgi:hypothetical protein
MMRKQLTLWIGTCLTIAALVAAGCGEHVQKKQEQLVSPSQEGTQAERVPEGPVQHGEAPSNTSP